MQRKKPTSGLAVGKDAAKRKPQLGRFFDLSSDAMLMLDRSGALLQANPAAYRLLSCSPETGNRASLPILLLPSAEGRKLTRELLRKETIRDHKLLFQNFNGDHKIVLLSAGVRRDPGGAVLAFECVLRDRTEEEVTYEALHYSEEKFRTFTERVPNAIFILEDNKLRYVNPATEQLTGYTRDELLNQDFMKLVHPDDWEAVRSSWLLTDTGNSALRRDVKILTKAGEFRWLDLSISNLPYKQKRVLLGSGVDVSDRKKAEERLLHDAFHDGLTGLANRALFADRLQRCMTRAMRRRDYRFAVVFLDLDRFKVVNDSLGHAVGDELLITASRLLAGCVRAQDTVARFGGDEFALLLDEVEDVDSVIAVTERIQAALSRPLSLQGESLYITASIGIALSGPQYAAAEELIRDADTAMYRAKSLGKARYEVFDSSMHSRSLELLQLENDMRRAIEVQDFELRYQPIYSLETDGILGFEALLRWRHPKRGLLSPGEFMAVAEDTGLIVPIGWWVLHEACRQMQEWRNAMPHCSTLAMSVNLSSAQLAQPEVVANVKDAIIQTGLPCTCLKLEITETSILENWEGLAQKFLQLRGMGIRISLDDFGTGYSSLSHLLHMPVDCLKIDREFIKAMGSSQENLSIVQAIIALSRSLKLEVTAEGLETEDQLRELRLAKCAAAQGYFIAMPMPAKEAGELLASRISLLHKKVLQRSTAG